MNTASISRGTLARLHATRSWLVVVATLTVLTLLGWPASSRAETTSVSGAIAITSLPCNIASPGTYYLASDLSAAVGDYNAAITISAANVTLDLNGHTLTDTDGTAGYESGIYVSGNNVTVRHGSVCGFCYGVIAAGSGCRVEAITSQQSTYAGICSQGANNLVRSCRVLNTGGSTRANFDPSAFGIMALADGNRVVDCDIAGVTARSGGWCVGIIHSGPDGGMDVGNRLSNCASGLLLSAAVKYRDTLCTASVANPYGAGASNAYAGYSGGIDAGNNR